MPVLNSTTFSRLFFSAWPRSGAPLSSDLEGALYKFWLIDWLKVIATVTKLYLQFQSHSYCYKVIATARKSRLLLHSHSYYQWQHLWISLVLMNKLVPCSWLLSGAQKNLEATITIATVTKSWLRLQSHRVLLQINGFSYLVCLETSSLHSMLVKCQDTVL